MEFGLLEAQEKYEGRPRRWGKGVRNKQLPKCNNLAKFKHVKEFRMIHNACRLMQMTMQMMQAGMSRGNNLPLRSKRDGAGQGLRLKFSKPTPSWGGNETSSCNLTQPQKSSSKADIIITSLFYLLPRNWGTEREASLPMLAQLLGKQGQTWGLGNIPIPRLPFSGSHIYPLPRLLFTLLLAE